MSAPQSTAAAPTTAPQAVAPTTSLETPLPCPQALLTAAKVAIQMDKPIQMDYYVDTCLKRAVLAEDEKTKDRVLIKSKDEYTSLINNISKAGGDDLLVITENSIYMVSNKIGRKKYPVTQLLSQE
jgi:hypothetical protein